MNRLNFYRKMIMKKIKRDKTVQVRFTKREFDTLIHEAEQLEKSVSDLIRNYIQPKPKQND